MEQIGTVMKTEGNMAVVTVNRVSACGENCAHCRGGCTPTKVQARVVNGVGAKVGDVVKLETETGAVIKASLILYFVPCVVAILGAVLASSVWQRSWAATVAFFALFFASFGVVKCFDRTIAPVSAITKIIDQNKPTERA